MKFSFTTTTLYVAAAAALSSKSAQAVVSPYVTCCEENGGTYKIVNNKDGQSGICSKDGVNTDEVLFSKQNCSAPSPKYEVYTVNNCDATVNADFILKKSTHGGSRKSHVDVTQDQCAYVGPTDLDTVTYTSQGSFVSGGTDSCKNIGNSNDSACNLMGMAKNACVINLC